jgi:hypothetical protein
LVNFLLFPPLNGYRKNFPKFTCPEWIDFSGPQAGSVKVFRAKIALKRVTGRIFRISN